MNPELRNITYVRRMVAPEDMYKAPADAKEGEYVSRLQYYARVSDRLCFQDWSKLIVADDVDEANVNNGSDSKKDAEQNLGSGNKSTKADQWVSILT